MASSTFSTETVTREALRTMSQNLDFIGRPGSDFEASMAAIPKIPFRAPVCVEMLRACRWRYATSDDMWVSPDDVWYYPDEITIDALGLEQQIVA